MRIKNYHIEHPDFVQYRYFRRKNGEQLPALTFRCIVDHALCMMEFSVAHCTEKDNFSRTVGRKIADARFAAGETFICQYYPHLSLVENAVLGLYRDYLESHSAKDTDRIQTYFLTQLLTSARLISVVKEFAEIHSARKKWGMLYWVYRFWKFRILHSRTAALNNMPPDFFTSTFK